MLKADNIHKTYIVAKAPVEVLKGASLEVGDRERVAVVGASGAGKSTLLHILGGLDNPDQGRVVLSGDDLYALSRRQRTRRRATGIGFVFQSYHLLPEMDVLQNVVLPAMALGRAGNAPAARERAKMLLRAVGLDHRLTHRPMELSGGEQQRVALARALMNAPRLVLADEPTGNLDDRTGGQVLEYLFELTRQEGHALVLVTHDRRTAALCDRALILDGGRIGWSLVIGHSGSC